MINRYPLWKNLLVLFIVTLGVVYALPNIYPPDFAVQISTESADGQFSQRAMDAATERLEEKGIDYFGAELADNRGLIRFRDDEAQLRARDEIQLALHDLPDDYIVALNSAPTTPEWLVGIGGEPMKYGLDLRGGVHFLMEVDTEAAIGERVEGLEQDIKRLFRDRTDRIRYTSFESPESGVLEIRFSSEELEDRAARKLRERYPQYLIETN
ncbi:MAG: protein translocase subunit SecD, partial [Pseudomonadales bacterium]|nr:protein translocase subunit SecD [Pseudomonadales bacterium]